MSLNITAVSSKIKLGTENDIKSKTFQCSYSFWHIFYLKCRFSILRENILRYLQTTKHAWFPFFLLISISLFLLSLAPFMDGLSLFFCIYCNVYFFKTVKCEVIELATYRYCVFYISKTKYNESTINFLGEEYDISWTMPQCVLCLRYVLLLFKFTVG